MNKILQNKINDVHAIKLNGIKSNRILIKTNQGIPIRNETK